MASRPGLATDLKIESLTQPAFEPFGDVIEARDGAMHYPINQGTAERFHDLAHIDTLGEMGRAAVSIVRAQPLALPLRILIMERHLLGSQAFVPLSGRAFFVVVAPAGQPPVVDAIRCFLCQPTQGINYARGTWHHPIFSLGTSSDFLVIDRVGRQGEPDCEEYSYENAEIWIPVLGPFRH